ncbi:MAG: DHHA1 domain-containing protein [Acidobacteriota bacterium]
MSENRPTTERLYYQDSHLLRFQARVLNCEPHNEHWAVVLDRTAFYPTGGGQPYDTGRLGEATVLDCIDAEDYILHIVDRPLSGEVSAEIDARRRRDHLQQHTGQHILSQAFIKAVGAQTRSFHMSAESSTIDLAIENLTPEVIRQAVDLANTIVYEDRPVYVKLVDENSLASLPLRKETDRRGCVRVIEIEDFDHSPCGGTHADRTGEVGLIVVRSWERAKRMCRVEFLCGQRVLEDYRAAHASAIATAALFSCARETGPEMVMRLQQEHKQLQRRIRELLELALESEACHLYQATPANPAGMRIIQAVFANRDLEELKTLAQLIVAQGEAIALLAATGETTRLVFARSKGLTEDCGKLMSTFCQRFGARGGGRADFAQGGITAPVNATQILAELATSLQK